MPLRLGVVDRREELVVTIQIDRLRNIMMPRFKTNAFATGVKIDSEKRGTHDL